MSDTRDIHVGTPAADFPWKESVTVHFHDFENLTRGKNQCVKSPTFTCADNEWCLRVYPGGIDASADGMVSVYLDNKAPEKIIAKYDVIMMKADGEKYRSGSAERTFNPMNTQMSTWGWKDYTRRRDILDESNGILNKGTLTVVIRIKPDKDYYCKSAKAKTPPSLNDDIFNNLFCDERTADVAFELKNGSVVYSHKCILTARVPDFAEMTEEFNKESPMPMEDVELKIFQLMLKYVYGKSIFASEWREHAKDIVLASGKYGFSTLRLMAEAWHVKSMNLSVDSAVDELLYADGNHCLDLKQAVIEFIVENGRGVLASPSYSKLSESPELMKEVMMRLVETAESRKRKLDELSP